jgi:hypothetical protein
MGKQLSVMRVIMDGQSANRARHSRTSPSVRGAGNATGKRVARDFSKRFMRVSAAASRGRPSAAAAVVQAL